MRKQKMVHGVLVGLFLLGGAVSAFGFGTDKFKEEVVKEQEAVKLTREVQQGGYGILTTDELKAKIDAGTDMLIIATMPYEDSYQKMHVPGAKQLLFPIP